LPWCLSALVCVGDDNAVRVFDLGVRDCLHLNAIYSAEAFAETPMVQPEAIVEAIVKRAMDVVKRAMDVQEPIIQS
jgi:hypothetical protein